MTDRERVGEVVGGKYRLTRFLASGGMGVVFEAQHTLVRRRFAVKLLRSNLTGRRDILTRFQREAEAAGALESEHVAAAVDFGILADGSPYIVMEYLVGESLESLLRREGRLPIERATDLVLQACRGVQAAHAGGIIHRDLKPQNLFVSRRADGTDLLKVLDFGIAKLAEVERNVAATRTGTILGTPAYMSPEQARGDRSVDQRTDVYALSAILYELLSGEKPHPADSHNAILHHISTQAAVPLASLDVELQPSLVEIVEQGLVSDPNDRHVSASALAHELTPFARRVVWPVPLPVDQPVATGELSSTLFAPEGLSRHVPTRSSRTLVALAAVAVIGVVAALAFARRDTSPASGSAYTQAAQNEVPTVPPPPAREAESPVVRSPDEPAVAAATGAVPARPSRPPLSAGRPPGHPEDKAQPSREATTRSSAEPSTPGASLAFDVDNPYR